MQMDAGLDTGRILTGHAAALARLADKA